MSGVTRVFVTVVGLWALLWTLIIFQTHAEYREAQEQRQLLPVPPPEDNSEYTLEDTYRGILDSDHLYKGMAEAEARWDYNSVVGEEKSALEKLLAVVAAAIGLPLITAAIVAIGSWIQRGFPPKPAIPRGKKLWLPSAVSVNVAARLDVTASRTDYGVTGDTPAT